MYFYIFHTRHLARWIEDLRSSRLMLLITVVRAQLALAAPNTHLRRIAVTSRNRKSQSGLEIERVACTELMLGLVDEIRGGREVALSSWQGWGNDVNYGYK